MQDTNYTQKPITITLSPPVTEHCSECDYEDSYSFGSYHCNCPKCGAENKIVHSARKVNLPPVRVWKHEGSYDFSHPSDKQYNYSFHNLEKGLSRDYTVNTEHDFDTDDPLECARELKDVFDKYIYTSSKDKIDKLVKWLEENEDAQYNLRVSEKREKLERELYEHVRFHGENLNED